MNENHPEFVGPKLPKAKPVWPGAVRDDDRKKWAKGADVLEWFSSEFLSKDAKDQADAAITRMLTGNLPKSAGRFTAEVSRVLCMTAKHNVDLTMNSAMLLSARMQYPVRIVPCQSGLAEVRKSAGRQI